MTLKEIRRLYIIISVIFRYRLDIYFPKYRFTFFLRLVRYFLFWIPKHHNKNLPEECLRLALQELGPVWIKLGQMLSTRFDLFSSAVINQLKILQNQVQPFDGCLARSHIEHSIGHSLDHWFNDFQTKPLASASISQVHTAKLKNGKEVIIKVIRPDILSIIQVDIQLMYRLAKWISNILGNSKKLKPTEVVLEYEKILFNELNLLREAINTIRLRKNFRNSSILYIPEVYLNYCNQTMIVMERIYGIPVNDIISLQQNGTNMKLLAEYGIQIFFMQVFHDNFFHGDMHPGNIFVSYLYPHQPKYIIVDCGIMGSLKKEDKQYLAENFIAFLNQDYRKVVKLHIDSGWVSANTNIEDFECALRIACEPIFNKPLSEISFSYLLINLFITARKFNMEVQPQFILLHKTLLYIESMSRQLYPQLDLWKTAKPFIENWIHEQVGFSAMLKTIKEHVPYWIQKLSEFPEIMCNTFTQYLHIQKNIDYLLTDIKISHTKKNKSYISFYTKILLLYSSICIIITYYNTMIQPIWIIFINIIIWIISWKYIINSR